MTCVLKPTLVLSKIWRLYVVFMHDWRVVILPVGSPSSKLYVVTLWLRLSLRSYYWLLVWARKQLVLLDILLTNVLLGSAYASVVICALPHDEFHGSVFTLVISAGVLEVTLNMLITTAIVARLWWIGRKTASLTATSTNRFASSIYIIIESGIILAICGAFVLALFASNSPAALTGLDVVSQLIVCVHHSFSCSL